MNQEIPLTEWPTFLEQFSNQHTGWLVTLDTANRTISQTETRDLPLQGISLDSKGSEHGDIVITVGSGDAELTHIVDDPSYVHLLTTSEGAHEGLEIGAADGSRVRLMFRVPALPDMLDGITQPR